MFNFSKTPPVAPAADQPETQLRSLRTRGVADADVFSSWTELEEHLVRTLDLRSAAICLLPNFVGSERVEDLGSLTSCELDNGAILLEVNIGYRARLAAHLVKGRRSEERVDAWPPKSLYNQIARYALDVFSRTVSDRVVELMAEKKGRSVAWFYFTSEAEVESASSDAEEFCRSFFPAFHSFEGYFPKEVEDYIHALLGNLPEPDGFLSDDGLAFAISIEHSVANCLLRRVDSQGYLFSMWRED